MSANPPAIASSSKLSALSGPSSPAQNQAPSISTTSFFAQQRGAGVGASARSSPTPRNNQQSKKQHKGAKRFRQTDEDAIVESVSLRHSRSDSFSADVVARHASLQQPQRADIHNASYELQSAASPAESPPSFAWPREKLPPQSDLGSRLGLSCC